MNARERYFETMLFGNPDKYPINPGAPRESTLKAWKEQGMPADANYLDTILEIIGVKREASVKFSYIDVSFKMIPEFEVRVLEHKNGHYIISDWMGAVTEISDEFDESYLRSAKDFVTRKWHKFPVETQEDWQEMKKRFNPALAGRYSGLKADEIKTLKDTGNIVSLAFNGVFWQLREWCGFENLCIMMIEQPEFAAEMADYWGDFVAEILKKMLETGVPDRVLISEDMAYKAHSMISPAMTRQFILPQYAKWIPMLRKAGCKVLEVDSDGFIGELIPLWIESDVDCCSPLEVAAHNDILEYRRTFGKDMAYMCGIDKRIMARGGSELQAHVDSIVPYMYKEGGFIPGCDHGVPPDISWKNFIDFTKMLAKHSGWL